jgi:hypothetical protein
MRLDEFQLAGQMPSNIQRAVPVTAQPSQPAISTTGTGATEQDAKNALISLVDGSKDLPPDSPVHEFVNKFLNTILNHIQDIPVQEASKMLQNIQDANSELLQTILLNLTQLTPEELAIVTSETADINAKVDAVKKIADRLGKTKPIQQAFKKQVATIELDVKGNIGKLDSAIEKRAQKFARDFGLPLKWARNLIGMFDVNITREQRDEFLAACEAGTALDVGQMIQDGEGRVEDYVLLTQPKIKDVYNSVKDTLLDISLSTGQRGATGPFEAMMAIMGGCKKPGVNEGGDLKTKDGLKLEVKATSISPSTESPTSGGNTNAWLDSTAGKEIAGSSLRLGSQ